MEGSLENFRKMERLLVIAPGLRNHRVGLSKTSASCRGSQEERQSGYFLSQGLSRVFCNISVCANSTAGLKETGLIYCKSPPPVEAPQRAGIRPGGSLLKTENRSARLSSMVDPQG